MKLGRMEAAKHPPVHGERHSGRGTSVHPLLPMYKSKCAKKPGGDKHAPDNIDTLTQ